MTLEEMKLAVCEKLPGIIGKNHEGTLFWRFTATSKEQFGYGYADAINWPTEGLQVCHEAEKLLSIQLPPMPYKDSERTRYVSRLDEMCGSKGMVMAAYEQRLEALCRVWFPEEFDTRKTYER